MPRLEKRVFDRIPAVIDFHCFNIYCFGTIINLSASGMFLRLQRMNFPFETQFEICIPLGKDELKFWVRVKRISKSDGYYDGVAVELLNPPKKYLKFITGLQSAETNPGSSQNR